MSGGSDFDAGFNLDFGSGIQRIAKQMLLRRVSHMSRYQGGGIAPPPPEGTPYIPSLRLSDPRNAGLLLLLFGDS